MCRVCSAKFDPGGRFQLKLRFRGIEGWETGLRFAGPLRFCYNHSLVRAPSHQVWIIGEVGHLDLIGLPRLIF